MKDRMGFWQGRVEVRAEGCQIEQFINLAYRHKINLISPRRQEDESLKFTIAPKDFFRLRPVAFRTGTRIRILKKRGFFRVIRPFRRRFGLLLGAVLFFGLIFYSSRFVWQVEVKGCETTSSTEVIADLQELGLFIGCDRTIDVGKIENRYLMGNDKLSWMSINIRGTTAYVEVKEKGIPPKIEDPSIPTNIYAARDGVILSIADYSGTRQVQVGEPVRAGDLLVSGDWTDKYGVRRLSHCIAAIRAETTRKTVVSVPLTEDLREKTGKKQNFFAISLGKFKFPLYFKQKISYNEYDSITTEYPLRLGSFAFPLRFYVTKVQEVQLKTVIRTEEEARSLAYARMGFYESDRLSTVEIIDRQVTENLTDGVLSLQAVYSCEEDIGIEMPIIS